MGNVQHEVDLDGCYVTVTVVFVFAVWLGELLWTVDLDITSSAFIINAAYKVLKR